MSESYDARAAIERISCLVGRWTGAGKGQFPTIDSFTYREALVFDWNPVEPLLHFEQRTWRTDAAGPEAPLHWESGFLIALGDGRYQMSNCQNGGRTEVLVGRWLCPDYLTSHFESRFLTAS